MSLLELPSIIAGVSTEYITSEKSLIEAVEYLRGEPSFAWDHETRAKNYKTHPVTGALRRVDMLTDLVSFSTESQAFVMTTGALDHFDVIPEAVLFRHLKGVMEDNKIIKYGYNASFDMHAQANYGVWVQNFQDVMAMAYLLDENRPLSLKTRCADIGMELSKFDFTLYWKNRALRNGDLDKLTSAKTLSDEDYEALETRYGEYSAQDAIATAKLAPVYTEQLKEEGLWELFERHRNRSIRTTFMMERRGMPIDTKYLADISVKCLKDMEAAEARVFSEAGCHFNIGSTKDLGSVLYDKLGLPVHKTTAKGAKSTDRETLEKLAQEGYDVAQRIVEYRQLSKLYSTYIGPDSKLNDCYYHERGLSHVHPSFNCTGTKTGRLSSSDPNGQNFPQSNAKTYHFRRAFIASPGYLLVGGDYCIAEGERVRTSHGYLPIEEVEEGMKAVQEDGTLRTITRTARSGEKAIVQLETESGDRLIATDMHKVRVINREGKYVFKRIKDLSVGDEVAISPAKAAEAYDSPSLPGVTRAVHHNAIPVTIPTKLSKELALWLGYMTGDGCVTGSSVGYVVNEDTPEVAKLMDGLTLKLFGRKPHTRSYRGVTEARFKSSVLSTWLRVIGFSKDSVPECVLKAHPEEVSEFLKGYMEADASPSKDGRVQVGTSSQSLRDDIGRLLHTVGVHRVFRKQDNTGPDKNKTSYLLTIPKVCSQAFRDCVGFISSYKMAKYENYSTGSVSPTFGSLPNQQLSCPKGSIFANTRNRGGKVSRNLASRAVEAGDVGSMPVDLILDCNMHFSPVREVRELGVSETYDIEVEGTHSFICEGFVTHNSQIELRIMAHNSMDPAMLEEYSKDLELADAIVKGLPLVDKDGNSLYSRSDLHQKTADGAGSTRNAAKTINFGLLYGMHNKALAGKLTEANWEACLASGAPWDPVYDVVTPPLAQEFIDGYFGTYRAVRPYQEMIAERAKRQGYITTRYGQKRRLPDLFSTDRFLVMGACRQAVNVTIQGHVGELMLHCMNLIERATTSHRKDIKDAVDCLWDCKYRLFSQVHDEVLGEAPKRYAHQCTAAMATIFQRPQEPSTAYQHYGYRIPLVFEPKVGANWDEVH